MQKKVSELIIVGDGIAGSLAAYVCAKLNIKALWFAPKNKSLNGAIQVPPNSVDALKGLGIFKDLKKHLTPISMIGVRDQFLKQDLSSIDVNNHYFSVARQELLSVIQSSFKKNSSVTVFEERIISIEKRGNYYNCITSLGNVFVTKIIIGADGSNGVCRLQTGNIDQNSNKVLIYRGTLSAKKNNRALFQSSVNLWLNDGWHLVYYPYSDFNYLNLILVGKNSIEKLNKSPQEEFKKLHNVEWQSVKTSKISSEAIYNSGQIFLIGDAAHPIYPHLAQGAAQTFLDAFTLLKVLSSNNYINLSLIEYAKIRTATINRVKDMSYLTGRVSSAEGTIAKIRNNLLLSEYLDLENFLNKIWEKDSPLNK